ncbi:M20/M25/M40 family metallo-hydrolase [Terriglobus albidus]|uniref:M20/M25/M40 family metallo-hydrolase n=1 Tax=Terriglobus albidus TaxID=1592106 RepID=A0A5B9EFV6_9BACT|nr:M20/M25/M40 family metallo-hydrolase [Terriglobus albidus]QEE30962.1 M20/M25/M40 family metallo-hydrolase [Terriglobus albidus]
MTSSRILSLLALTCSMVSTLAAQQSEFDKVRTYANAHRHEIVAEYLKLLSLPNIHGDAKALQANADLLAAMMKKRGLDTEIWPTSSGVPMVFGEKRVPGAKRTILFYIHYDGQPVDVKRWAQPDPFVPVVRTDGIEAGGELVTDLSSATFPDAWRIYARAAGDDKAPIEAMLCALDAIGSTQKENVKIFLDGEEEGGGKGLAEVIQKYPEKLRSDLLVILDGPQHPSGPTIYYGARGGASVNVTVYTAKQGMHSGNYGNWMPDANVRLAQLIASMVDSTGKVVIPGFYSDVLPFSTEAKAMIDAVPDQSAQMQRDFGVGSLDGAAHSLQEGLNLPAFSVHTMKGGEVGGVIAANATAEIAMRLVKENRPQVMAERVIDFIRAQGYYIVDKDPDVAMLASHAKVAKVTSRALTATSGGAWRTDPNDPQAVFATNALKAVWGDKVVRIRTLGGSVPASPFIDAFHVPTVGVSIANYDDNQHTDNENIRLGNLFDGMTTLASLMLQ